MQEAVKSFLSRQWVVSRVGASTLPAHSNPSMPINPRSSWYSYRFVLPVLAVEILFVGVPLVIGIYYNLHQADYFQLTGFVGLANYVTVLKSPVVRETCWPLRWLGVLAGVYLWCGSCARALSRT